MSHDDHGHSVNYLYVFFALLGFTGLSVLFDQLTDLVPHAVSIVLVLAVAVAKALCVMMFFMHLKFEGNWKYVLLAPTSILAVGLPLALLPDIGVAYYTPLAPQQDWLEEMEAHAEAHGHHGDDSTEGHTEKHGDPKEHAEPNEHNEKHQEEPDEKPSTDSSE